jgi:hypothetical protein
MDEKYVDPVCGMEITTEETADSAEYDGEIYYFVRPAAGLRSRPLRSDMSGL